MILEKSRVIEMARGLDTIPTPPCGIYYLIDGEEIVYVGQSKNIYERVKKHISEGKKKFDKYSFFLTDSKNLNVLESTEIIAHSPKYNIAIPENDVYKNAKQLKFYFGIGINQVKRMAREMGVETRIICGDIYYKVSDFEEGKNG